MKTAVLALAFTVLSRGLALHAASEDHGAADRDWSEIYLASSPCVSPDGAFFAFAWNDRIWLAPIEGGTATPLGDGQSCDSRPYISPDGKKIAFLSDRWGPLQLFEADLDAGNRVLAGVRQVTFHTESLTPWGYAPDGKHMLAVACRDDSSESETSKLLSRRPMLVSMSERRAERLVFDAPAFSPALSPDGRRVLFVAGVSGKGLEMRKRHKWSTTANAGDIWMYDLGSGAFTSVVSGRPDCCAPVWTPDGRGFYYLSDERGVRNLRHRSLESGEDREITSFTDDHMYTPSLSRDGRTMVFAKGFDLWRIDPTAESPEPVRIPLRSALYDPSAPRSVRRSYSSMDNNYGDGNCTFREKGKEAAFTAGGDVWAMELKDGGERTVRVHGSSRTHERDCAFSPDGSTLYYLSDRGDGTDVWRARRADTNRLWSANSEFVRERLTRDDACRRGLSVSPDGTLLAWVDAHGRLSFADTNGVVRSVARTDAAGCGSYAWSPDGRYVAASLSDALGNADVWIVPTWDVDEKGAKAPEPCNVSRNWKWDGDPAWSSDGRVIAFAGDRTSTGNASHVFYAYLDPEDEFAEASEGDVRKEACVPDFSTLPERVRATGAAGYRLMFAPEGRTLSFFRKGEIDTIKIPGRMKAERLLGKDVKLVSWLRDDKNDVLLGSIDRRPSVGEKSYAFEAFQTTDVQDYQELAFLTDWAKLRDRYCDPEMHGADWPAAREKFRLAARYAPSWNMFASVVRMMHGELDSSHLGFSAKGVSWDRWAKPAWNRGWTMFTAHLGARFDRGYRGEGWRVRDVIPRSDADRGEKGLLPGDVVVSVDGRPVMPDMDYAEVMNGPLPRRFRLQVKRGGCAAPIVRDVEGMAFWKARRLMRDAEVAKARAEARRRGNFGYIAVNAMKSSDADDFTDEVFAECFGRRGLVVDVRFNTGGHTADRIMDILCGIRHERTLRRGMSSEGFLMDRARRPVVADIPVVVIANEQTFSNGEELCHAMRTLGRGRIVGTETAGDVIATVESNVLDYGVTRVPWIGTFLPDGTDMEGNGAKPDVAVPLTPPDIAAGNDPQLAAAIKVLEDEVAGRAPPPRLRFSTSRR